jgi:hypothetical protein
VDGHQTSSLHTKVAEHLLRLGYEPLEPGNPFTMWRSPTGMTCSTPWAARMILEEEKDFDFQLKRLLEESS